MAHTEGLSAKMRMSASLTDGTSSLSDLKIQLR
jgi:hypothetical protein